MADLCVPGMEFASSLNAAPLGADAPASDALDTHALAFGTVLSIVPRVKVATVHSPGVAASTCVKRRCTVHTSDWREVPGSPLNTHRVLAPSLTSIRELFELRHDAEALCMGYVLSRGGEVLGECPRIAKESLQWLRSQGYQVLTRCFIGDIDTPGHVPWTPEMLAVWHHTWATAEALQTCAGYLSTRGSRVLQPLADYMPVEEAEPRLHAWLQSLVAQGVWASVLECKDWTHLMRVPSPKAPWVSVERLAAVTPPLPLQGVLSRQVRRPARTHTNTHATTDAPDRTATVTVFDEAVPPGWEHAADALGAAIRDGVQAKWRRCYMALSGALIGRGCPHEGIPAVVARAHVVDRSYPTWETVLADRVMIAQDSVNRHATDAVMLGYSALRGEFPAVADALDAVTTSGAEARVLRQLAVPAPKPIPVEDAVALIGRVLREAWAVVLIAAPPGTGKTYAVTEHVRLLPRIGERAAPGARVAVSTPTHALAKQTAAKLAPLSLHLFSPPSHVDDEGVPTCIYVEAARGLAKGGQSVAREFCEGRGKSPCEVAATCPARLGVEGDPKANLVTGVHGLMRALQGYAGPAGLLVVDEPGEVLDSERVTLDQIETARRYLGDFEQDYANAMAPALEALWVWVGERGDAATEALTPLSDAVRAGVSAIPAELLSRALIDPETPEADVADAVLAAVAEAVKVDATTQMPPIKWTSIVRCRPNPGRAAEVGEASRVLLLLRRGLIAKVPHAARIDERGGERAVTITGPNEHLLRALKHEGPVVVLDANAALHAPAFGKILGYTPRLVELAVADGAPIARTVLVCANATRTGWLPRGVPDWVAIVPALRAALAWASEDLATMRVGLILPKEMHAAVAHVLRPDAPETRDLVKSSRLSRRALNEVRDQLAPVFATFAGEILTGHYGGLEGLDFMADCDATITLGDPRPNLGDVRDRAAYLGLDAGGRLDALAAAELQQAHGRLRTIHRRRPGRQLHVGAVVPAGWPGLPVEVRRMPVGRPCSVGGGMTAAELCALRESAGMAVRELARALGITHTAVGRYEAGERSIPSDVERAVRSLARSGTETPNQNSS